MKRNAGSFSIATVLPMLFAPTSRAAAFSCHRGFVIGILVSLALQSGWAQAPAPAAVFIPGQPAFQAGAVATFTGRDFAPGESVTFQVTHVRGTPVSGTNHNPAQVVADAGGAFKATWLVCSNDCVGELLQIEATGGSSSRVGRAVFQDLPAPPARPATWLRTDKADYAPGATANITGGGFQAGETVVLQVLHADGTPDSGEDHAPWSVVANATGGCQSTWHVCEDDCLGSTLKLFAAGQASGKTAQALFTDAGGAPTFERVHSFGTPSVGGLPGALLRGTDGAFYGTAGDGGTKGYGTVFKMNADGSGLTVLKNFDRDTTGAFPNSLLQTTDGALYGAAAQGGSDGYGTIFKLNTDGSGFTVLKNFDNVVSGGSPIGLVWGADGKLYGTASVGGSAGYGTVFKLNTDGTGFVVLQIFDYTSTGGNPFGRLLWGTDGRLYGTTPQGGSNGDGTIFGLNTDGSGFTVLKNCSWSTTGANPYAGLLQGADGKLYGACEHGGPVDLYGTVFKLNPDGTDFTVIANFDYFTTGAYPITELLQGTDGQLYGGAYVGVGGVYGGIFKLNPDGTGFTVLKTFDDLTTYPSARLVQGPDGALYGVSIAVFSDYGTAFKLNTDGTGFTVLSSFSGSPNLAVGGGYPQAGLLQAADGKLYGATSSGGSGGYGAVFKMNPDGSGFSVLKDLDFFTTGGPAVGLIQGTDGALYGTATYGGGGFGTIFKLNPDGSGFTVIKVFDNIATGIFPFGAVIQGTDGAFYGTTANGGPGNGGTVFKLNADGTGFTVLRTFANYDASGSNPEEGLVQGPDGALYGTMFNGGASNSGIVFRLNPDGTGFTVLKDFDGFTTGVYPHSRLLLGLDGALYGTTTGGGSGFGGTVFKLNPDGSGFAVLQNFDFAITGGYLYSGLVQSADGMLYGVAVYGGAAGYGTIFRLNPDGTDFAVLQNLDLTTGPYPFGGLLQGTDGNIYGTTLQGGDANAGTVFRLVFPSANTPPVAKCKNVTVLAGVGCAADASIDDGSFDPDTGDTITLTQTPPGPYPLGQTTVTLTATDSHGASSTCTAVVTVVNPDPVVSLTGPVNGALFAVNAPVNFTATFTDANGGTHTGTWMFDAISQAATIVEPVGPTPGSATATHTFTAAGVYTVKLTVYDNCGGSGTGAQIGGLDVLVIVYDPSAGFVAGSGWILSPPGAYAPAPTLTGKANFGFVSKYQKGQTVPKGETQFQLHSASFDFKSTSYQWLVVSGARAQFKGFGQINSAGNYGFLLTATDGQVTGGGGVDKFRIKIWDQATSAIIYDNAMGSSDDIDKANPQAIGAGSIVIQK